MFSQIGSKINELRVEKKLTLKDLSRKTNLSVGFLSQLERGLTTVAIDSLESISRALGVDISLFFTAAKEQNEIIQKSYERKVIFMDEDNFIQFHLSNNPADKKMLPRLIEVYPKKDSEAILSYSHEGEEFIYILEGILTYHCNGQRYELYPGDSAHINSSLPHNWENNTSKMVKLLMVSVPNRLTESIR